MLVRAVFHIPCLLCYVAAHNVSVYFYPFPVQPNTQKSSSSDYDEVTIMFSSELAWNVSTCIPPTVMHVGECEADVRLCGILGFWVCIVKIPRALELCRDPSYQHTALLSINLIINNT